MRFFFFHLMPYADLDLDYDKLHKSSWVTLPNDYYDPVKGADLYHRYLDELEYAAELGFEGVGVNEHHQNAYGLMPAPTSSPGCWRGGSKGDAKICILGRALPVLSNPLSVAEEFAVLDNVTRGRIITGFVRGIGAEYHSLAREPDGEPRPLPRGARPDPRRLDPARSLRLGGQVLPLPAREPLAAPLPAPAPADLDPQPGLARDHRVRGRPARRYVYLQTATPAAQLFKTMQAYRDEAQRRGYQSSPDQLGWSSRSTWPRPTRSRGARRSRTSSPSPTSSCACRRRCCCRRATPPSPR